MLGGNLKAALREVICAKAQAATEETSGKRWMAMGFAGVPCQPLCALTALGAPLCPAGGGPRLGAGVHSGGLPDRARLRFSLSTTPLGRVDPH